MEIKIHHVKQIGESERTDCGLRCTNGDVTITQGGKITCNDCINKKIEGLLDEFDAVSEKAE